MAVIGSRLSEVVWTMVYNKKENEVPSAEQFQFIVYKEVCMENSSMVYPTLAIERLNTVMLTYYSDCT